MSEVGASRQGGSLLPKGRAELLFAGAGLALIASQVLLRALTNGLDEHQASSLSQVMPLILGLAVPTGLLLAAGPRLVAIAPSRFVWLALIGCGIAMRLVWLGAPPPLETDHFRYLWDGALVARGLDPYAYPPALFLGDGGGPQAYRRIAEGAQATLQGINFPAMRTIYPSVAQAAFAMGHLLAPFQVDGLRLVFLVAELVTLWLLIEMLRRLGRSPLWSALYWWNPFVAYMLAAIVHVDALLPPFVLGGVLALARNRPLAAVALFGLGAGVKVWPLILAPMALWPMLRQPRRLIAAVAMLGAVLAVSVGPVVLSAMRPGSGLSAYAAGWSSNNALYAWLLYAVSVPVGSWEGAERLVRPVLALATAAVAITMATRGEPTLASICRRALVVTAAMFYLSPAQFPWYALWFLPLAVLTPSWPLLLASATLPTYYLFFPLWPVRNGDWFFYGTAFLHALPVLGWLLYDYCRMRHDANPPTPNEPMNPQPVAGTNNAAITGTVAVVIPVLNEAEALPKVLASIPPWVAHVIVADNGSSDGSGEIARKAGAIVVEEPRRGYGSACLKAIAALPGDVGIVVFMDGDASDDTAEMSALVDPIARGEADMVLGSRVLGERERGALTPQQIFGNALACGLIRLVWGVRFTDLGPFRAIGRAALTRLEMADRDYGWTVEMQVRAAKLGLRSREIPARYRRRIGTSKVSGTIRGVIGAGTKILYVIGREALARSPTTRTSA